MWHGSGHNGLLLLLLVSSATAFLLPATPSPHAISSSAKNPIARFASSIDEAPSLVEPQELQPQAEQEPPPRGNTRRPLSPKPVGPWVLLEGLPYAAVESDIHTFLEGFEVKSITVPLSPENTKRAGREEGREGGREGGRKGGREEGREGEEEQCHRWSKG
ncbi:hypothetical protein NSK_008351 [Nannochloropsis salina CCMP1776]|uniref:RRM domain-containing protein n=1 Tax=Nannochloropsis salina CCMP1776 TaxID=1027361 RepID=A0A4D9CU56_9STRA|nr:hypothetical protein NSK_008351 [Nannochloropsis salina CCMP1776]|eukprot:TFJ80208.1 hypothetical protein NSK_008351 [Nannochloropsis salina CCMP1776]